MGWFEGRVTKQIAITGRAEIGVRSIFARPFSFAIDHRGSIWHKFAVDKRIRFVVETVQEIAALPLYWIAAKVYTAAERIAPERLVDDPGDGYPAAWQEETPEVTRWRQTREGTRTAAHPDPTDGEGVCADVVPLDKEL